MYVLLVRRATAEHVFFPLSRMLTTPVANISRATNKSDKARARRPQLAALSTPQSTPQPL